MVRVICGVLVDVEKLVVEARDVLDARGLLRQIPEACAGRFVSGERRLRGEKLQVCRR